MAVEHKNILDPNIHEPKGISTAVAESVYVADGLGSGVWKSPSLSGQTLAKFNSVPVADGSGGITWRLAPAFDPAYAEIDSGPTIRTLTQNVEVSLDNFSFDDVIPSKFSLAGASSLTVNETGIYMVHSHLIVSPQTALSVNNEQLEWRIKINGTIIPQRLNPIVVTRNSDSSDRFMFGFSRIIDFTAGDVVTMTVKNLAATRNYSTECSFNLIKLSPGA